MSIPLTDLRGRIAAAAARSDLLQVLASVKQDGGKMLALGDSALRSLTAAEIARLEQRGNTAEDWSRVLVADAFVPERVRASEFRGDVLLGRFAGEVSVGAVTLPAGICDSTLVDCVVGHDALVRSVKLLAGYVVGPGAVLLDCGRITCDASATFGNNTILHVGCETGGRPVAVFAEMTIDIAAVLVQSRHRRELLDLHAAMMADYLARATSNRGVIERGARILSTQKIHNACIGPNARVDGAALVENATLLSSEDEPARIESGACVSDSIVQWGSSVETLAVVQQSLLTEHSHVERHGKVTSSVLGPNTSVGSGEVTASLLGPFVACHHQSLLIATLWPEGRGNIGYGANVGSNHTSRAPDQECRAGEGLFFGLGVNVKFPADFSLSPYTVVACGANLLPQKVCFPFSLIAPPSAQLPGVSPAFMEIIPGWMLRENLYALRRNETKYRARNRARRAEFEFEFLRPDTIDLVRSALRRVERMELKEVYTEEDIDGLGKNILLEKNRREAVESYRFILRYYALYALLGQASAALADGRPAEVVRLLDVPGHDSRWEHARQLAHDLGIRDVLAGLREMPQLLEKLARGVEDAKARDDRRGAKVIADYANTHTPATQDECVRSTWEETRRLTAEAEYVATRLREFLVLAQGVGAGCRTAPVVAAAASAV